MRAGEQSPVSTAAQLHSCSLDRPAPRRIGCIAALCGPAATALRMFGPLALAATPFLHALSPLMYAMPAPRRYVGDDVSPDFYGWVFPKYDHVAVGTGTVVNKTAIKQ